MIKNNYINYRDLNTNNIEYINKIPKIIHRTLLFDLDFPKSLNNIFITFNYYTRGYITILWREKDLINILNNIEKNIYFSYKRKIQKADFARYIILKKYGGIYADLDIQLLTHLDNILNKTNKTFLCIEETILSEEFHIKTGNYAIRQFLPHNKRREYKLRIANYFIASSKESLIWNYIIKLCIDRYNYILREEYDIYFTTGPDIISTVISENINTEYNNIDIIRGKIINNMLTHVQKNQYHKNNSHWKKGGM